MKANVFRPKIVNHVFYCVSLVLAILSFLLLNLACSAQTDPGGIKPSDGVFAPDFSSGEAEIEKQVNANINPGYIADLERIAEIERAGSYYPGLALVESGIREKAGDYSGAALAVFKELSWAYGYGAVTREQAEEGLINAVNMIENSQVFSGRQYAGAVAFRGCLAFIREEWEQAETILSEYLSTDREPDSFLRWMLLVCAFERGENVSEARLSYGAIRARYSPFPEYWYRGARVFSHDGNISASYAERCIDSSPTGPFSAPSRDLLSHYLGLSQTDIMTKAEIENTLRNSIASNDPEKLEELFPLMALPDNPYTLYALGVMKSLSGVSEFKKYFLEKARVNSGRLGERLNYISRG